MGTLIYGKTSRFEFDDRTLDHVRFVIVAKLRKRESFFLTWSNADTRGAGSTSLWISPAVPLVFEFASEQREPLSREWIDALTRASYTNRGLVVMPERAAHASRSKP